MPVEGIVQRRTYVLYEIFTGLNGWREDYSKRVSAASASDDPE